ncbi:MFS transporter [Heyndrickxia ginsengihumi]|uniref:MFS transporter n=1 Tax=Heyndrickxia ginsengihumi TaxID=363870 RepID=UPI003D229D70
MHERKFRTYQNGLVLMIFFTIGFVFMDRLSITFLFPFIKEDLNLNNAQLGLITSVLAICFAISGWLFSSIGDVSGKRKKILVLSTVVFSLCSIFTGVVSSCILLLFVRSIMGLFEGPVLPLGQAILSYESSPDRRGFNMGLAQSAVGLIGAALTPIVVTKISGTSNWHVAFYVVAIPGLLMAFLLWKYLKEPSFVSLHSTNDQTPKKRTSFSDYANGFKHRNVGLSLIMFALFNTWLFVFTAFAPTYLVEADHYSAGDMGIIMAAVGLGSFFWGFLVPMISDKLGRKPTLIIFSFIACLCPIVFLFIHASIAIMVLIGFITAVGQGCMPLLGFIIISESVPARLAASVGGMVQGGGELVGGALMPLIAGILADHIGLTAPLWIASIGSFIAAFIAIGLIETAPIKKVKQQVNSHQVTQLLEE